MAVQRTGSLYRVRGGQLQMKPFNEVWSIAAVTGAAGANLSLGPQLANFVNGCMTELTVSWQLPAAIVAPNQLIVYLGTVGAPVRAIMQVYMDGGANGYGKVTHNFTNRLGLGIEILTNETYIWLQATNSAGVQVALTATMEDA